MGTKNNASRFSMLIFPRFVISKLLFGLFAPYLAYEILLERAQRIKARKNVTHRTVTKEDIECVLD
jgi:hypothetical protein